MPEKQEIQVFISHRESTCGECGSAIGSDAWVTLRQKKGVVCLACSDLDHLVFLASGDAALTRRARKHSGLHAVVLEWSKRRKRYERQGLLVESEAVECAEKECEQDKGVREMRAAHAAVRRAELDENYIRQFAVRIREVYPYCPQDRETVIANHACRKYSGRVGRCASAKALDEKAVRHAVNAHVRHTETSYDSLLLQGYERWLARERIQADVSSILARWEKGV